MSQQYVNLSTLRPEQQQTVPADAPLRDKIIAVLRNIYDPEIPVNIYDLGLVYAIDLTDDSVTITMTLTTPNCPVADAMPAQVEDALKEIATDKSVKVNLTWDPPWDINRLTDEIKLELGLL